MTGNPDVISSSVGLVPRKSTEDNLRLADNPPSGEPIPGL